MSSFFVAPAALLRGSTDRQNAVAPKPEEPLAEGETAAMYHPETSENAKAAAAAGAAAQAAEEPLKRRVFKTMEDPSYSALAKVISLFLMGIILLSTICFILESEVSTCKSDDCDDGIGFLAFDPWAHIFYYVEWVSVVIFTMEYILRIATCPNYCVFLLNLTNFIDLIAWLPFWIIESMGTPPFSAPTQDGAKTPAFGFVRAIRLIRVFRVFKFGKYSLGIRMFGGAIANSVQPMAILCVVLTVATIIFSSVIWLLERPASSFVTDELMEATGRGDMQAICFGTIPSAFWWALTTMTTVGYGDCFPITLLGKMVTVFAMICGVIVLALPITVLGSNFATMVELYAEESAQLSMEELDEHSTVGDMELREFIHNKRRDGLLRKDVDTKISTLMHKYNVSRTGTLTASEFCKLQQDVVVPRTVDQAVELASMQRQLRAQGEMLQTMADRLQRLESIEHTMLELRDAMRKGSDAKATQPS